MRPTIKTSIQVVIILLISAVCTFSYACTLEESDVNLKLAAKDVFVFKNGIGLVLKSGKVSGFSGSAITGEVPDALLGSLIT